MSNEVILGSIIEVRRFLEEVRSSWNHFGAKGMEKGSKRAVEQKFALPK